jgi:hypothetical protein
MYIGRWWTKLRRGSPKGTRKEGDTLGHVYVLWNIWKERSRRIFQNKAIAAQVLAQQILTGVDLFELAHGRRVETEDYFLYRVCVFCYLQLFFFLGVLPQAW